MNSFHLTLYMKCVLNYFCVHKKIKESVLTHAILQLWPHHCVIIKFCSADQKWIANINVGVEQEDNIGLIHIKCTLLYVSKRTWLFLQHYTATNCPFWTCGITKWRRTSAKTSLPKYLLDTFSLTCFGRRVIRWPDGNYWVLEFCKWHTVKKTSCIPLTISNNRSNL